MSVGVPEATHRPFGSFGYRTVVDTFDPRVADMDPGDARHGMNLQAQYFYGGLRDAEGVTYMVERKFAGPMTNGLWLMSDADGDTNLLPQWALAVRGETLRDFGPDHWQWNNHLLHTVGNEVEKQASGNQPLSLRIEDSGITWSEGALLDIHGGLMGPGFQIHTPDRDEPMFYTTQYYWVRGAMLGKEVEGFIGLDHSYMRAGVEWKEYRYYGELEISWTVFANRFADDTREYGVIVTGAKGFGGAVVYDGTDMVACTSRTDGAFDLDEDGNIEVASLDLEGTGYTFTGTETGKMPHFSKARWSGYRAQAGITRRAGDNRPVANAFAWTEFFPQRIVDEGLTR